MNANVVFRSCVLAIAGALAANTAPVYAQQVADPPMSPAVFEDVPAPDASAAAAPVESPHTIAVVTLQTPSAEEIDTGIVVRDGLDQDSAIRFEDLPRALGTRVRVLTRGQRLHRGVIQAADAHRVTLMIKRRGGSASYVLRREQVQRIDPD